MTEKQSLQKCTDFHTDAAKFAKPTYDMVEEDCGVGKHFSQWECKDRCRGRALRGGGSTPTRAISGRCRCPGNHGMFSLITANRAHRRLSHTLTTPVRGASDWDELSGRCETHTHTHRWRGVMKEAWRKRRFRRNPSCCLHLTNKS